jgi:AcrR family transcriptional regulator
MRRRTRREQAELNRERILAVARSVFLRNGYYAASIDEIAEEAGFSKGVIYSQFGSKADLFFALLERRVEERAAFNLEAALKGTIEDSARNLLSMNERMRKADRAWTLLVLEFRILAARDPELQKRYSAMHRRTIEGLAEVIEQLKAKTERPPAFESSDLARLVSAIDSGYALEESIDPEGWSTAPGGMALRNLFEDLALQGVAPEVGRRH